MLTERVLNKLRHLKNDFGLYRELNFSKHTPIIVYQMGKVGSRSVVDSLESQGVHPVYHIHRMNPENIADVRREYQSRNLYPPKEDILGLQLYNQVIRKKKPARIITLVREPIGRNISAFFQNFERFTVSLENKTTDTQTLIDLFMKEYRHNVPLTWFDMEIKTTLGIDVYAYPFDPQKGYMQITHNMVDLLIIKLEIADRIIEEAVRDFLGLDHFALQASNVGENKSYSDLYTDFKQSIRLPVSYVEEMCQAKYTQHFYDAAEIEKIRQKWLVR